MHFRPALRAFSECTPPLHCPSSRLRFQAKPLRNRLPVSVPGLHLSATIIETGAVCHAIVTRSVKSGTRAGNAFLSPACRPSSVWTMSLSSASSAGTMQNPVPAEGAGPSAPESSAEDVIVQYIVMRKDLVAGLNWPLGSVISQGCHAAVAAIWLYKEDPVTLQYCASENLDNMHKVTLEVKGETQLRNLAQKLESGGIGHKLWIEQPENYATCLATKPYPKSEVASYFKKLQLCK